ncbi:MAG: hypothetical protein HFG00_11775 [Oscillibacter sp.]|nr:hypothetical protein [Oscillibacter sp.]
MKRFWKWFRKADEMEQSILLRAQRNAYLFLVAALVAWTFWESAGVYHARARLNLLPCLLLAAAALIQGFSQLLLTRRAVKDDEDSCETWPLARLIGLCCLTGGLIAAAVTALLVLGVRL